MSGPPKSLRRARATLLGIAGAITLVAVVYAIENWRGKKAWENCKRQLEAKGEVLDWNAYVPPPVPDDQNIFKAPRITEWFIGRGTNALSASFGTRGQFLRERNVIAALKIVLTESAVGVDDADIRLRYHGSTLSSDTETATAVQEKLKNLVEDAAKRTAQQLSGRRLEGAQGITLFAGTFQPVKPGRILILADRVPNIKEVAGFFPTRTETTTSGRPIGVGVEATGNNSFNVCWGWDFGVFSAADYLAWTDRLEPEFEIMRQGWQRPFARIDTDYRQGFTMASQNFVIIRMVAQTIAQRAQCHLLLAQPGKALEDLTLLHQLSRVLETKPATLVAAMINVAVTGLYVQTVAEGLNLHAWEEPQLAALEAQLAEINLSPLVRHSLRAERASACDMLERTPPGESTKLFLRDSSELSPWERITNPRYLLTMAPHGWIYQNMAAVALVEQTEIETFDSTNGLILPRKATASHQQVQAQFQHRSVYNYLASVVVPNFVRALQTEAATQTKVNQALVACALERFRLDHGEYPESLEALMPKYSVRLPPDLIDGQPLRYRRFPDGKFLLYSIGWNEMDEGGKIVVKTSGGGTALDEGDWVWAQ